jgi:sugar lactone lactonase YvrE
MSGNRFEFLELGEDGKTQKSAKAEDTEERIDPNALPAGREPLGPRDAEGRPLAQVRPADLVTRSEVAPQIVTPRESTPTGLRVAETIGSRGTGVGQFNYPTGVALDSSGILYVADSYNHRLQRITPTGGVALIGTRGGGRGQFLSPQGVATDARSAFYVVEGGNNRVQKFSDQGVLELIFGRAGSGTGEFRNPTGIAIAPTTGDIYVADTGNSRVQRFDAHGNYLATLGGRGGIYVPLVSPQSVAVDSWDNLYVADTFAHQIVQYDALGRLARRLTPGLHEPRGIAWEPRGLLYVVDVEPGQELAPKGRLQTMDGKTGMTSPGAEVRMNGTGSLSRPGGIAVSWTPDPEFATRPARPELYVADTLNHRVLRLVWS